MPPALPQLDGVEHRFVDLPGLRMHVAEAGHGDPVVLLHGFPQHWWEWRRVIPDLADRYRVICPDLRGFGWSDAPSDGYDKETLAYDVLGLLDALGLQRVCLVGHDVGGFVGFLVCLKAPERVERYLALNTGHPFVRPTLSVLATLWRFWYWPLIGAPFLGPWLVRHEAFSPLLGRWFTVDRAGWTPDDAALFAAALAEPARALASSRTYRSFLLRDSPAVLLGRYRSRRLRVATRMLHGLEDRILRPAFLAGFEPFAEDMTIELVPGVGHFIAEEAPELVVERALDFLSCAPAPATT
jgi:pimeloyl-ACP methyl ester carboxylesterase